jgi:hypothetical protein
MTHRFALVFGFGFLLFALAAQAEPKAESIWRLPVRTSGWRSELERVERRPDRKFQTRRSESPLILMAHMVLVPACPPAFGPKLTAILPQAWCCSFDGAGEGHRT